MAAVAGLYGRRRVLTSQDVLCWAILVFTLVVVFYPVILVVLGSFQSARPDQPNTYGLDAWRTAFTTPDLLTSIWNTIDLTVARQLISLTIAIPLAWALARTDIPGSKALEFMFWVAFFMPTLPVLLGWIILLAPDYGLLNRLIKLLPFVRNGPFDIYSFWGIVWVHLVTSAVSFKVMLLTPAFRNMDASLEEASHASGAGPVYTMVHVVIPAMAPIVSVVLLLTTIYCFHSFEIELVLGVPIRFFVFSSLTYQLIGQEPPLFPNAAALSTMVLLLLIPFVVLQRWIAARRSYEVVGGKFRAHLVHLRQWRWPAFAVVLSTALLITVVPVGFLIMGTFMKLFGFFSLPHVWTFTNWTRVVGDPIFLQAIWNTVRLSLGVAVCSVALCTGVAYIIVRTKFVGRSVLDFATWFPVTLPGTILGLGLLWLFLENSVLRTLYGTLAALLVAVLITSLTTSVQVIKSNFAQLGSELEEAARASGASWWYAFRTVLVPLLAPSLLLVGALGFIAAARDISTVVLLATNTTRPLSILQLDFMVDGRYESASVIGVIIMLMTVGVALIARLLGLRIGVNQSGSD